MDLVVWWPLISSGLGMGVLKNVLSGMAFALGLMICADASAQSVSSSFPMSLTVMPVCQINSVSGLTFVSYDPTNPGAAATAAGAIYVACTKTATAVVSLDQGQAPSAGSSCAAPQRRMTNGSNFLAYNIFTDAGLTQPWGCSPGSNTLSFSSLSAFSPVKLVPYGYSPSSQDVPAGTYTDTVTITVSF